MNKPLRKYATTVGWAGAAYLASVIAAALLTKHMGPGGLRVLVSALPLPAILWLAWANLLRLRRHDELRQRIELEAMSIAFAVSFGTVAMLALFDAFGTFTVSLTAVTLFMTACWFGAQVWVRTRYRYACFEPDDTTSR